MSRPPHEAPAPAPYYEPSNESVDLNRMSDSSNNHYDNHGQPYYDNQTAYDPYRASCLVSILFLLWLTQPYRPCGERLWRRNG